jgi:hypothetical protein
MTVTWMLGGTRSRSSVRTAAAGDDPGQCRLVRLTRPFSERGAAPDRIGWPGVVDPAGNAATLTYHAARAVLQRANAALGSNWTLHDLRHTAAARMLSDPGVPRRGDGRAPVLHRTPPHAAPLREMRPASGESGPNSRNTSCSARSRSATVTTPTERLASMSTRAAGVGSCASTQRSCHASRR